MRRGLRAVTRAAGHAFNGAVGGGAEDEGLGCGAVERHDGSGLAEANVRGDGVREGSGTWACLREPAALYCRTLKLYTPGGGELKSMVSGPQPWVISAERDTPGQARLP